MVGDIAENERNESDLHVHIVLGRYDGSTQGGHLMKAIVRPTLGIILSETPTHLKRHMHKDINVALIDISRRFFSRELSFRFMRSRPLREIYATVDLKKSTFLGSYIPA